MMSKINKKSRKSIPIKGISNYVYLSVLVVLPLILNWKIISYDFTSFDDKAIIANNLGFLSDFNNVFKAFGKDNFMSKEGKGYYRPIQTISFMIDAQINNEKPDVFHFSNIFYHILTVIVLFSLLRKLQVSDNISFFLALLFSVHPLFTNAIAWIPGRGDLLAGLFCSVSFLSFIYYDSTKNKWYFFFHSAAFVLALFSKEISVFLPVALLFYYWIVLKNRYKIRYLVPFIFVWSFSVCLFFLLRHLYLNYQDILSFKAFISNLPVIPIFLSKLVVPLGLSPLPLYDILFTIIGLILFISLCVYIAKMKSGNKSLIILGIVWFLGFIIPAMFAELIFAKVHSNYLECRAYLPSIGIFIALGVLLNEIIKGKGMNILMKSFIPVIVIFSLLSYNYSEDFKDTIAFYSSLIKSNPWNAYALSQRGCQYLYTKNFDLALADFDNSIKASPTFSDPYFNKGIIYHFMNDHVKAEHFLSLALNYDTLYPESASLNEDAFINLSSEKLNLKKYDEMIALLKVGLRKYPDNCSMHNNLGLAYYSTSKFDLAVYEYSKAIKSEQNEFTYYNNRGMAEYHLNKFTDAVNDYSRALELKPDFLEAWENRGMVNIELNDFEGAISDLTKAISIKQDVGAAWYFRGIAYSKLNRITEAVGDWKKAMGLGYSKAVEMIERYNE
jgi:tetratricopeptide (TPR) repeat protein